MSTLIISRREAQQRGLKRYFTGKPCNKGHIAERSVVCWNCVQCDRERVRHPGYWNAWRTKRVETSDGVEKERLQQRLKFQRNPDRYRRYAQEWSKNNPNKVRVIKIRRRARQAAAIGEFTPSDIDRIRKLQNNCCAECSKNFGNARPHIDHIIPLFRGGSNWPSNLQLLCKPCNSTKGARDPIDHAKQMGRLL